MKRLILGGIPMMLTVLLFVACTSSIQTKDEETAEIMNGLSNNGHHGDKSYLTAGDRTYIVGTQDGNFPDLGSHVKGEMGGVWMQPIKLMDGFWMRLSDAETDPAIWLSAFPPAAREMISTCCRRA